MTGTFGELEVLGLSSKTTKREAIWECKCLHNDCGNIVHVKGSHLRSRAVVSCGCLASELVIERNTKHGLGKHPLYTHWHHMHSRCYGETTDPVTLRNYQDKGVTVCERWHRDNPDGLKNFIEDMGEKPFANASIDRFPNRHGNYSPENCRWANQSEQVINQDRHHGLTGTYLHDTWAKRKSTNSICEKWSNDFKQMIIDLGEIPENAKIARITRKAPLGPNNYKIKLCQTE